MQVEELGYKKIQKERIKNIGEENGKPIETLVYDLDENGRMIFEIRRKHNATEE